MRAFLTAVAATVVFGLLAAGVLRIVQRPAYQAFSTSGVRLSDPGENLVGQNWNGLNEGRNAVASQPPHG
jgi:hypothetical protein